MFKKFNLKTSVSNAWMHIGYWTSLPVSSIRRREVDWLPSHEKTRKFTDNNKMHWFRIFHCGLRAAVNPLRCGPLLKTIQTCRIDVTASYANNDAVSMVSLILCFSQTKTEFY